MSKGLVLVVEDNLDNYELVRFILEREGYETFLAISGQDGIDAALKQKPDLILMDLALPGVDGWAATQKIKSNPAVCDIPLIALTVHTLPKDRRRAIEAGVDGYITKPYSVSQLVDTVENVLQKKGRRGEKA